LFRRIYQNWFVIGLILIFFITIGDGSETVSQLGRWSTTHYGPDIVIILIFFFSGLILNAGQIRSGIMDIRGLLSGLALIFFASPLVAAGFGLAPLGMEIKIGIFLVAVMPSTLSSGVVMTGMAGGNMAHAMAITILANSLSVLTIPISLSLLLNLIDGDTVVDFEKTRIMIKIFWCVLIPLLSGLLIKYLYKSITERFGRGVQLLNQVLVLGIVWMALSQSRPAILSSGKMAGIIILVVLLFHGALLSLSFLLSKTLSLGPGRRESVILMGGQKTLPLSVILQVALFPHCGLSLVVCVMHHIIHLIMDGYVVVKLKKAF